MEFVITGRGTSACFCAPPSSVIAVEIFFRSVGVCQVADGHHRTWNFVKQFCCGFRAGQIPAISNIPGAYEDDSLLLARSTKISIGLRATCQRKNRYQAKQYGTEFVDHR